MESRMEKYYEKDLSSFERSKKNSKLYKEISKEISDLDNLPIPDNSNEIDLDGLKKIIYSRDEYRKAKKEEEKEEIKEDKEEERISDSRIYDINVLLENAKNEMNEMNQSKEIENTKKHNFLANLEEEKTDTTDDNILLDIDKESFSLDLFGDLRGDDNTLVTDPIVKDEITMIKKIKDEENFYSGTFNFDKKDFDVEEEENFLEDKSSNRLKIVFLLLSIIILVVAIYFILTKYILE